MPETIRLAGIRVDQVDWQEVERYCSTALNQKNKNYLVTINGEIALLANKNPDLKDAIERAGLVIPDSTNIVWCGRLKGGNFKERTPGSDLVYRLAALAARNDYSLFLLGGKDDVAQKASDALIRKFPGLKVVGTSNADPDDANLIAKITESKPDILLVAYGAPKQEVWLRDNLSKLPVTLGVGVGGTFDMLAGILPRAPKIFRALSLEWLWRLIIQPSRIGRIWRAVVVFPIKALFT